MPNYNNHTRYFYANSQVIQDNINSGVINQWDIVICKDTKEQLLVTDNLETVEIKSRIYRFVDTESAETFLNSATDTYEGQIVSILSAKNGYQAYIVNRDNIGNYVVKPISVYNASDINYSDLGQRPIDNLQGDIENPVILSEQSDGIYKIDGAYKLSKTYQTIFQSANSNLYLVSFDDDGNSLIKIISASEITDYTVSTSGEIIGKSTVPTSEWLEDQNYITEDYLDTKLATLGVMTKEETQQYVQQLLNDYVDDILDEKLDQKLEEKLGTESAQDITAMFLQN
jgi:hypothetical protein